MALTEYNYPIYDKNIIGYYGATEVTIETFIPALYGLYRSQKLNLLYRKITTKRKINTLNKKATRVRLLTNTPT